LSADYYGIKLTRGQDIWVMVLGEIVAASEMLKSWEELRLKIGKIDAFVLSGMWMF
jgi:hypothetical protein